MAQVAAGNRAACSTVASRLAGRVRRLSRMILLDASDADDAAQQALLEVLKASGSFRGQSSVERWADRITARTAIRMGRAERRQRALLDAVHEPGPSSHTAATGSTDAIPRELDEYLTELPPVQREVLVLKHVLDYTVEEISEVTGVPVGTVKDRLVNARRQVRKSIRRDLAVRGGQAVRGGRTC